MYGQLLLWGVGAWVEKQSSSWSHLLESLRHTHTSFWELASFCTSLLHYGNMECLQLTSGAATLEERHRRLPK